MSCRHAWCASSRTWPATGAGSMSASRPYRARSKPSRAHHNVLAIALANKLARIAWSVLISGQALYGVFFVKGFSPAQRIFSPSSVSLFDLTAVSSSRRALCSPRRAQEPSRLAVAPIFPHAPPWPGHTLTALSTTSRLTRSGRRSEGSLPSGTEHRATTLYSVGPWGPDHDAVMRIGGEAPRRRTHSRNRCQHHGLLRVTATSDRHRMPTKFCSSGAESLSCLSTPLTRLATPRQLEPRQWLPDATGQLAISAQQLRSLSCAFCRRFQSVYDTIGPMHCPSGRAKSAKPTESFRGVLVRCPPWRALSLAVCCRSRLARQ